MIERRPLATWAFFVLRENAPLQSVQIRLTTLLVKTNKLPVRCGFPAWLTGVPIARTVPQIEDTGVFDIGDWVFDVVAEGERFGTMDLIDLENAPIVCAV